MILRDPADAATAVPGDAGEPVARAVALFASRTWPGEGLTDGERHSLVLHARTAAGLGDTEGGKRKTEDGKRDTEDGGGEARRMEAALDVARRTPQPSVRSLARRGTLRPCVGAARPGFRAWTLDLAPLAAACNLELGAYRLLRDALEGIADLWAPGERPVLVLNGLSSWPGAAGDPAGVKSFCESVLQRLGAGRGWRGAPEVLRSGLS